MATPDGEQVWAQVQPQDRAWLSDLARRAGPDTELALVGGAVRDALLGQTPLDLDIVVAGQDGQGVEALAQASGLPFVFHPAFENATLTLPDGRGADLVRARREHYPQPGRNPEPLPGTLHDDLRRRDFGLNALALRLREDSAPELLDVVGGLRDLERRELRPLHDRSLHEDASRLVRAARLAARLELHPAPELLAQVPDAQHPVAALDVVDRAPEGVPRTRRVGDECPLPEPVHRARDDPRLRIHRMDVLVPRHVDLLAVGPGFSSSDTRARAGPPGSDHCTTVDRRGRRTGDIVRPAGGSAVGGGHRGPRAGGGVSVPRATTRARATRGSSRESP